MVRITASQISNPTTLRTWNHKTSSANTSDSTMAAPVSTISSPIQNQKQNQPFTVSWGSGATDVANYTIYVSQDMAPYYAWQSQVPPTMTSGTFTPSPSANGHTYYFSSVAQDLVGNTEPTTPLPGEASTHVVGVEQEVRWTLALEGARPNPAKDAIHVWFTLPNKDAATLELLDVAGRRVMKRDVGSMGPGPHLVTWGGPRLKSGLYFLRLLQGGRVLKTRVAMIR